MKKFSLIFIASVLFFALSCSENETDTDKLKEELKAELKEEMKAETEKEEKEEVVKNEEKKEVTEKNELVNIHFNDIKKGMMLGGMEVTKLESRRGDYFDIQFAGEFIVEGDLVYNEFEDSYFFNVDEEYHKKYTVKFPRGGGVDEAYEFYSALMFNFNSRDALKKAYGIENVKKAENGTPVKLKIKAKNLSIGAKLDKGMLGLGVADFVELY